MKKYTFALIACSFFCLNALAQGLNISTIQAKASWGIGGLDRVVFESHSLRTIARYDSFTQVLEQFLTDADQIQMPWDTLNGSVCIHYAIFPSQKRKLWIENPEFLNQGFDFEKEIEKVADSLPDHIIRIYDARFDVKISIYLENIDGIKKLRDLVALSNDAEVQRKNMQLDTLSDHIDVRFYRLSNRMELDYWYFQRGLRSQVYLKRRPRLFRDFNFYAEQHQVKITGKDTQYLQQVSYNSNPIFPSFFAHTSAGLLGSSLCFQINTEIPLWVQYEHDLPKNIFYVGTGGTIFTNRMSQSDHLTNGAIWEGVVGLKLTNLSPDLKSTSDFRVAGLELGAYLMDPNPLLLHTPGWLVKSYRQYGNFRWTSGFYWSSPKMKSEQSNALLFTVEIFDVFKESTNFIKKSWRDSRRF